MRPSKLFHYFRLAAAAACIVIFIGPPAEAQDKENCLMCHKYQYLGRIDEKGERFNYNVDEHLYADSVHRSIACRECHTYIKKIPHDPVTGGVNCANVCHVKPPHSQQKFSHTKIIEIYKRSVHAAGPDDPPEVENAKPNCKFCHLNPLYTPIEEQEIDYEKTLQRCLNCHEQKGVVVAYMHVTHRLRKKTSRSPQEIVKLCSKCHADREMMKKADASKEALLAVETYERTIHGKSVALGSDEAADCISCHASNALHDIYKKKNENATIHEDNLMETCKQCHEQTNSWFVEIAVHPRIEREENPVVYFASIFFRLALYGSLFSMVGLMAVETYGRKKDGVKFLLRRGTAWRRQSKQR